MESPTAARLVSDDRATPRCADRSKVGIRGYVPNETSLGSRRRDDMLEKSALRRIPVVAQLRHGRVFEDRVTDIGTWGEEHWVAFALHDFTPLRAILELP